MKFKNLSGYFDGLNFHEGPFDFTIDDGIISSIEDTKSGIEGIDCSNCIVSVPFNDAHTHAIFAGNRFFELSMKLNGVSYSEILEKGGGIRNTTISTREASNDTLKKLLFDRLNVMRAHGTHMVEIKSGYGLNTEHEIRLLNILNEINSQSSLEIIPTFGAAHVVPHDYKRDKYIEAIIDEMLPIVKDEKLATSTDVFCDKGAFTVDETLQIFDKSKKLGIPIRAHAEEIEYTGIGKIAAERYNALSVDHLLLADQKDFEIYAKYNTVANFMPLAPIGLFSENRPKNWKNTEVTIGLGSDFNPNNWVVSMQTAIRFAVFTYRMSPLDAFRAATSGSYKAMTGKNMSLLKEGEIANIIILKARNLDEVSAKFGQNLIQYSIIANDVLHVNSNTV